ncbi:MAG: M50 family metallopeptidase, partial [Verrucomicrobiia bacterium]
MAILLLPLCVGVGRALARLIAQFGMVDTTVVPLAAGAGCMFLLYHYAPKPMWIYVFGHEFTHAAATMACGGRVKGMKVTSEG